MGAGQKTSVVSNDCCLQRTSSSHHFKLRHQHTPRVTACYYSDPLPVCHVSCMHAGPDKLAKVLLLATMLAAKSLEPDASDDEADEDAEMWTQAIKQLLQLPSAQALSADCIVHLLLIGMHQKKPLPYEELVQLPGIQLVDSESFCKLVQAAGEASDTDHLGTVAALCR